MNIFQKKYLNLSGYTWLIIICISVFFFIAIAKHQKEKFSNCGNLRNIPMKEIESTHEDSHHDIQEKVHHEPKPSHTGNESIHMVPGMTLMCFYTNWCGYSKKMMGQLIPGHDDKGQWDMISTYCNQHGVNPIAVDAEKNKDMAMKYKVRGFPTCVLLKDNTVIKTIPGFRPAANVIEEVEKGKANPVPEQTEVKLDESGLHLRCFYASWCHFSKKMMGPIIKGHEFPGEWNQIKQYCDSKNISCTAVDAEDPTNEKLAKSLEINGFPTCVLFKDGKPIDEMGGYMPASNLIEQIKKHE